MLEHSSQLVEEARLVTRELVRVAILQMESWHGGLEEASKFYAERDIEGMLNVLAPRHELLMRDDGNRTPNERVFVAKFGSTLQDALEWCHRYQRTRNSQDITNAWDAYYNVYVQLDKMVPQLSKLPLKLDEVSPKLRALRHLQLPVPGTYGRGEQDIRIEQFIPQLKVLNSKQRPRKLKIIGTDGLEYQYLLKAHEDLRLVSMSILQKWDLL